MALMTDQKAKGSAKSLQSINRAYVLDFEITLGNLTHTTDGYTLGVLPAKTHVLATMFDGETQSGTNNWRIGYDALDAEEIAGNTNLKNANLPIVAAGVAGNMNDEAEDIILTPKTSANLTGKKLKVSLVCVTQR